MPAIFFGAEIEVCEKNSDCRCRKRDNSCGKRKEPKRVVCSRGKQAREKEVELDKGSTYITFKLPIAMFETKN